MTMPLPLPRIAVLLLCSSVAVAAEDELSQVVVSATRAPQAANEIPLAVTVIPAARIRTALTLDAALADDPTFSLFRRTSSLTANPTAQGVSLRGIGPSGASRTLVLVDGVPLNDPFGGWVTWNQVPRLSLGSAELVHGGGSGVWGNSAIGGVVALTSAPTQRRSGRAGVELADYATRRAELSVTEPLSAGFLRVDGSAFATNGFYNLAAGTRGAVDRPLASDHQLAQVSWNQALTSDTQATVMGRIFSEHRNNGTALQQNDADTKFVSAALSGAPRADFSWNSVAYVQQQSFSSFFSSVSADRMTETPANNQFDVPASAAGASYTATWREDQSSTTAGTDLRWVKGETREQFLYQTGRFTRGRFAGGAQGFAGAFVHHRRDWAQQWSASIDLRLDYWKNYDGHTREYDLTSGASTLNASYHDQSGWQFSPRLGVVWQPDSAVRVRSAVYRAFRLPTLNEYYRPFRVGNVNTLANAALTPETLDGAELGIDFTANTLKLSATAFANQFEHAVGNITLSSTPAAVTRQRQNIDEVRIRGLELSAQWTPIQSVELRAGYILDDAHVGVAHAQPTLVGHRLAEVPRQTMTGSVQWTAPTGTRASVAARYVSAQFDDDENLLTLAPATTVDVRLEHRFGRYLETFAALENALDAKVQTSRSTAGLFTYNTPRMARGGVRIAW